MREKTCLKDSQGTQSLGKNLYNPHPSLHLPLPSAFSQTKIHSWINRIKRRHEASPEMTTHKQANPVAGRPSWAFWHQHHSPPLLSHPSLELQANFLSRQSQDRYKWRSASTRYVIASPRAQHCSQLSLRLKWFSVWPSVCKVTGMSGSSK